MGMRITRRQAMLTMGGGALALMAGGCHTVGRRARGGEWFRGNLHMHTYWSDGRAFPEQAVDIYKELGYNFLALSEHNVFADNPNLWKTVEKEETTWPPEVTLPVFDAYLRDYAHEAETRQSGGKTQVRLKSYDEMRKRSPRW